MDEGKDGQGNKSLLSDLIDVTDHEPESRMRSSSKVVAQYTFLNLCIYTYVYVFDVYV